MKKQTFRSLVVEHFSAQSVVSTFSVKEMAPSNILKILLKTTKA